MPQPTNPSWGPVHCITRFHASPPIRVRVKVRHPRVGAGVICTAMPQRHRILTPVGRLTGYVHWNLRLPRYHASVWRDGAVASPALHGLGAEAATARIAEPACGSRVQISKKDFEKAPSHRLFSRSSHPPFVCVWLYGELGHVACVSSC